MVHERLAVYSEKLFSDRSDGNFPGGAIADLPFFYAAGLTAVL